MEKRSCAEVCLWLILDLVCINVNISFYTHGHAPYIQPYSEQTYIMIALCYSCKLIQLSHVVLEGNSEQTKNCISLLRVSILC